ncbi:MAG: TRAP transporter large permease subunit [Chloroflexota bacterium]|nr:TRAP transporter large permease subunit [Chloroflexota bacterium]
MKAVQLPKRADPLDVVMAAVLAAWLSFQVLQFWVYWDSRLFVNIHVTLAAAMTATAFIQSKRGLPRWLVGVPALAIALYTALYFSPYGAAAGAELTSSSVPSMVVGGLLLVVVVVMVWRAFGPTLALLAPAFTLYMFLGKLVPAPLTVPSYGVERIFSRLTLGAIHGELTYEVANYLWLLIFWGILIQVSGAGRFIRLIAQLLSRRLATGPALAAVATSALVGSFTGTGSANVMVTGSVTIPLMQRAGYRPVQAAAIESAASTAAAITPPVMGIVPFIMAATLGVPYTTILGMVLLIAVIWYVSVIIYILAASARLDLRQADAADESPLISLSEAIRSAALMIVPVGTLVLLIFRNWPLVDAVTWATVTLAVLAIALRVERSPGFWWEGIKRAAVTASAFSLAIVVVQYVTEILFFSTLIIRVGAVVDVLGTGSLIVAGLVVLVFGVLISGPLPPLAVYFVMVIAFQPVFYELGLPPSITVFTAFYIGVLGAITLPMAPSTMVAAGIARAPFLETAIETMKVASAAFFIPFLILLAPELLISAPGVDPSSPGRIALVFATAIATLSALSFGLVGWLRGPIRMWVRVVLGSVALFMIVALQQDSDALLWACLATAVVLIAASGGLLPPYRRRASP